MRFPSLTRPLSLWALLVAVPAVAAESAPVALVNSVPPAVYAPRVVPKAVAVRRLVSDDAPRHVVALGAPEVAALTILKSANALARGAARGSGGKGRPLVIGIGRAVPAPVHMIVDRDLAWQPTDDGGRAARIDVTSEGAAAVRVAIAVAAPPPGLTVRFAGSAPGAPVFGPYAAERIAAVAHRDGVFWSPVLEGTTATIELHAPAGRALDGFAITIARVSHLALAGAALRRIDAKTAGDIGTAQPCEIDIACLSPPSAAVLDTARSVAKLVFTHENGDTLLCTGTLLNDSIGSLAPYLFTADHCIDSQYAATTLNTYWFFDAVACGSRGVPPFVLHADGGALLARSRDSDWSLVRLDSMPPVGARFSAWTAEPVPAGTTAITVHHPSGDLKKWTQGFALGITAYADDLVAGTFLRMQWTRGSTEAGSSGAGVFTYWAPGGYDELRGGLYAGTASCTNPSGFDLFTRIEDALPLVREYLTPNANPAGLVPVVEFYHKALDHYFITASPAEIHDLDAGVHPGWVRTGFRFLAYRSAAVAPPGANPVCRFYFRPEYGNSHFLSADPGECAAAYARFGAFWIYETAEAFFIQLPDKVTGTCPPATRPLYRFYNTLRINHRYTAETGIRDDLRMTPGWLREGYGPDATIMCSPSGS